MEQYQLMANILIIDDDPFVSRILSRPLEEMGHRSRAALSLERGLSEIASSAFDVVFLDVLLPDGNGLEAIKTIKLAESSPEVIIITAGGEPEGAELAIRSGAWDYIQKPLTPSVFQLPLMRALEHREMKLRPKRRIQLDIQGIVGKSRAISSSIEQLANASASETNVLLMGETGTGKELFARAVHVNSSRCDHSFVVVDCAALPESIVESVLFGHMKGAFTGAEKSHTGLIKQADGGTLFLDEVGELPLSLQKSFLRALQERRFLPVGSKREECSNFRLIAATNRNLEEMVASGSFRSDLFFRLHSYVIELPPLRERKEDLRELATSYVERFCERYRSVKKGISPDFFEVLEACDWPGNVRELHSAIHCALTSAYDDPVLNSFHLPADIRAKAARFSFRKNRPDLSQGHHSICRSPASGEGLPLFREFRRQAMEDAEKKYFVEVVSRSLGDLSETMAITGLSRTRLYYFLQKYGLSLPKGQPSAECRSQTDE